MKIESHFLFALFAACGQLIGATYDAHSVTDKELEAAKNSRPDENRSVMAQQIAADFAGRWIANGNIDGKILFHEDFSGESPISKRWSADGGGTPNVKIAPDDRGGSCLNINPLSTGYSTFVLKNEFLVPVSPDRPAALLWEARSPLGGRAVWARIDFFDENKKMINASYQMRSKLDPTQPHLFNRNAELLNRRMPSNARFVRAFFFHSPSDTVSGQVANIRIVDYTQKAKAKTQALLKAAAEREISPRAVLVYSDDNLTSSFPVLPQSAAMPGKAGRTLRIRECPGEKTRATAILWSKTTRRQVRMVFSPLRRKDGAELPASVFSAKIVKTHYQAEGAPNGCLAISENQVLVPELLLNDDSLVVADHTKKRNLVKYAKDGREWYVDINTVGKQKWGFPIPASSMPIFDAPSLCPFDLKERQNLQLALRLQLPDSAEPGNYMGKISFVAAGETIAELPVSVEVLPFRLPKTAETVYDPSREYCMGLYVWANMNDTDHDVFLPFLRSRRQVKREWETLLDNGVNQPLFIWFASIIHNEQNLRRHLELVREVGFPGSTIRLADSGLIGNSTDPAELGLMQKRLKRAMEIIREYGFDEIYFYGFDEAVGDRLFSQFAAWQAARDIGAKVFVSSFSRYYEKIAGRLDMAVLNDDPANADTAAWHKKGTLLWKYNTPQAGPEDPGIFRRNYGLDLWRRGFDGASTYCDVSYSTVWNDIAHAQARRLEGKSGGDVYRAQCMVYPTADGVVETLALTGLESAIKDVRIMTKLRRLLREHRDAAAEKWLRSINYTLDDPQTIRRAAIDHILRITLSRRR